MGRPSTSGYCHTCRKRRIKCDRKRPSCSQCIKTGYSCRGYDLGLRIQSLVIVTDAKGSQHLAPAKVSPTKPSKEIRIENTGRKRRRKDPSLVTQAVVQVARAPSSGLSVTAFQHQLIISYFYSQYTWASLWKPFIVSLYDYEFDTAGRTGLLAVIYGLIGMAHDWVDLQIQGRQLYGQCISQVQALIGQCDQLKKPQVARIAMPVMLMSMYSFAIDKDLRMLHHLGMARILQYCGPEAFQEEPLLSTFRSVRAQLICQGLATSQSTFLEEKQWKTVPFYRSGKTQRDKLIDIVADIPSVMQRIKSSAQTSSSTTIQLGQKLRETVEDLNQWRSDWGVMNNRATSLLYPPISVRHIILEDLLVPSSKFSKVSQALELLTYSAAMNYLVQLERTIDLRALLDDPSYPANDRPCQHADAAQSMYRLQRPDLTKALPEPTIEGLGGLPLWQDNLPSNEERVMITLFPVGAMYCVLRNQTMMTEPVLAGSSPFSDAATELDIYEVASPEPNQPRSQVPII